MKGNCTNCLKIFECSLLYSNNFQFVSYKQNLQHTSKKKHSFLNKLVCQYMAKWVYTFAI
jgi:hypothetical protein